MRKLWTLAVVLLVMAAAGCGSSDQTTAAAKCLQNALTQHTLGYNSNNCADTTAAKAVGGQTPNVTCTHKSGNGYICDVKPPPSGGVDIFKTVEGFYDVTYDGKSIVYQQTQ